jgi:GDP-L-fucose synthase
LILLTGATGFLGKTVAHLLDQKNIPFKGISQSLGVNLINKMEVDRVFQEVKPDSVIHCAAHVGGIQFGIKYPVDVFIKNMQMTLNVLEACKEHSVRRFVHPVSNCVYPGDSQIFREEELWQGRLHPSVEAYGSARKALIVAAQGYKTQFGLESLHLICPNMYGPGDHFEEERSHALGAIMAKILEAQKQGQESVNIWGSGAPVREWLYVEDAAEALIVGVNRDQCEKDIYNIGSGEYLSIREIAHILAEEIGYKGAFTYDLSKPDGALHKQMEFSVFCSEFSWQPKVSLREGIRRTIISLKEETYANARNTTRGFRLD